MTTYTTTPATKGERTVLLVGLVPVGVFVGPDHAELAERVKGLLNRDEVEKSKGEVNAENA